MGSDPACERACMSVHSHTSKSACSHFSKFSVHAYCSRSSVLLWWQCCMVCISSFVDDVMFGHNRLGDAIRVYTEKKWLTTGQNGGEVSDIYYCLVFNVCVLIWSLLVMCLFSAAQSSHCKRCTSYSNSICLSLSVRPSVCLSHAGIAS